MNLLWLVPLFPFLGFLSLLLFGRRFSKLMISLTGVGSVGLSALVTAYIAFIFNQNDILVFQQHLWQWLSLGGSQIGFSLYLDALALVMICVVTGVGWLIHWYAAAYMQQDDDLARFFAYMNLFVCAMLLLVLADNLVLLYLGWEGVGLCSFLLIGFWYKKPENAKAAKKAFIVTRIGDTSMLIGLLILFGHLNELQIQPLLGLIQVHWINQPDLVWWASVLLLGGAVGKSAQLPLHTWLPDAMAGPTPVSALIHAATMVTAGVYLIARMFPLYSLSVDVMTLISWIGVLTLLLAGLAALQQSDLKRILAYSTVSQIGYMMLALGAGGWGLAIFHLMTHAFFKALLFLIAGTIILKHHHDQNIFNMGGLYRSMPITATLLVIGLAGLTAIPGTSGFFSKEAILNQVFVSSSAGPTIWILAVLGALLTAIYSFRLMFIVLFGSKRNKHEVSEFQFSSHFVIPLIPLAVLALFGGFIPLDLSSVFGSTGSAQSPGWAHWTAISSTFIGLLLAYVLYLPTKQRPPIQNEAPFAVFLRKGLGFDQAYYMLFVRPFMFFAQINKSDIIDKPFTLLAWFTQTWHETLSASQNGRLRWYATGFVCGTVILIGVTLWLV